MDWVEEGIFHSMCDKAARAELVVGSYALIIDKVLELVDIKEDHNKIYSEISSKLDQLEKVWKLSHKCKGVDMDYFIDTSSKRYIAEKDDNVISIDVPARATKDEWFELLEEKE